MAEENEIQEDIKGFQKARKELNRIIKKSQRQREWEKKWKEEEKKRLKWSKDEKRFEHLGFGAHSIEHPNQPPGGRNLEEYENLLGFKRSDLANKNVLDLGCGPELKLARELKNSQVTSFSPDLIFREHRKNVPIDLKNIVGGIGQNLPFKDETFDYVLASHLLEHISDLPLILEEVGRVLVNGGKAIFGPATYDLAEDLDENEDLKLSLEKMNVSLKLEEIPRDIITSPVYEGYYYMGERSAYRLILEKIK